MMRVGAAALLLAAAAPAAAASWTVDPAKSRLGFTATWLGKPVEGSFQRWVARIAFDPAAPEKASIDVSVDLASVATGDRTVDGALPDSDWFAVARSPRARFVATSVRKTGTGWLAAGTLTLKGRSAPVELPFTLAIAGDTATVTGAARVDRRTWQLGLGSDAAGDYVAFPVAIRLALVAKQAP